MTSTPFLDRSFQFASIVALSAWAALFLLPTGVVNQPLWVAVPVALLCAFYGYLLFFGGRYDQAGTRPRGNFRSMRGVLKLFQSPRAVLVGWVHFLAFDLMIGLFIVIDAADQGIAHGWTLASLFLTLMLGPLGLLSYFLLRILMG